MKIRLFLVLSILIGLSGYAYAQTQQGYVKTKGRMMNGKYYAGKRIGDATVQIKDRSAMRSRADGTFSFPVSGKNYSLEQVIKQGYELLDQDVLYKQYSYSSNPLVIVMEDKVQMAADRRKLIEQVESFTKEQLRRREAELEALREQNKITVEKYQELLGKLNNDYDKNEQLVKDMVEQYNKIDFDQEDEFNRRFSDCIINGRLDEADSLLRTKGDVDKLIEQLNKHHVANEQARATLSKSEAAEDHERQNIADVCYKKFQVYKMRHMNDSAAYYIKLRCSLDREFKNPEWFEEAAYFLATYLAQYKDAIAYLKTSISCMKSQKRPSPTPYIYIGQILSSCYEYENALDYFDTALDCAIKYTGEQSREVAVVYGQLGIISSKTGKFEDALVQYEKSLNINKSIYGENSPEVAIVKSHIGSLQLEMSKIEEAMRCFQESSDVLTKYKNYYETEILTNYENMANAFGKAGEAGKAITMYKKALKNRQEIFGQNHPSIATDYYNIGVEFAGLKNWDSALYYYPKSLLIDTNVFGYYSKPCADVYGSIGSALYFTKNIDSAKTTLNKALSIYEKINDTFNKDVAYVYTILGDMCVEEGKLDEALQYVSKYTEIYRTIYGESHPLYAVAMSGLADIYEKRESYPKALECFQKAYSILKAVLPEDHPAVQLIHESIVRVQRKIDTHQHDEY